MQINPCPKCGRKPCEWIHEADFYTIGYEVKCYYCGLHTGLCKTYAEAVAKWNELTKGETK